MMATFLLDGRTIQDHFPGLGRYAYRLANALAAQFPDHRFRLVFDPRAPNSRFPLEPLTRVPNVECVPVHASMFSLAEQRLGLNARLAQDAAAWHSTYYTFPLSLHVPLVVTLGDLTPLVLAGEMPGAPKRLAYRLLNQLATNRARALITFSQASGADLARFLNVPPDKLTVIPLAADAVFRPAPAQTVERVRASLDLPQDYTLYVGSNKPHKNLPRLVQAWAGLSTRAVLVIAGPWDSRYPQAQELTVRLGLTERVLFRHDVIEADLPALVSGARLFVFPSVHEGFGLPPLEAMQCGTPVACARVSALSEVTGDAAFPFDPFNVPGMSTALSHLLEDADLRAELADRGLRRAQLFTWERTARETMAAYLHKANP